MAIAATVRQHLAALKVGGVGLRQILNSLIGEVALSGRIVILTATGTIFEALHEGKTLVLDATATLVTLTMPAATGSGARYSFVVKTINTSSYVIQKAGTDVFRGQLLSLDNDASAATSFASIAAGDDVLTLNGTTTGGQVGDWVEFQDIAAGVWSVIGTVVIPAGSNVADPFS